jgi:hypothetical protein
MKKYLFLSVLSINLICIGTASSYTRHENFRNQRAGIAKDPNKQSAFTSGKPVSVSSYNSVTKGQHGNTTVQCNGYSTSKSTQIISSGEKVPTTHQCSEMVFTDGDRELKAIYPASSTTTQTTVDGKTSTSTTSTLSGLTQTKGELTNEETEALKTNNKALNPTFKIETTY